ncbi:Tim44/TimA family putative adaptor protein [Pelagibacteraceae bacterium]|nr:Tim44/TimA family putative adaptor protein [Pelagibacteraceae bacterium]
MSENFGFIDIILLAMIAGFIFLRLRNVLGKGADNSSIKPNFANKSRDDFSFVKEVRTESNKPVFDEASFKKGAEYAYEMIINGFANGDKQSLKQLLTKKLYLDFEKIIDDRNEKKLTSSLTFIGIEKMSIDKVSNVDTKYKVTARFISQIINCLKNEKSEVVEGDAEKTKTTTDVWSFERDLKDSDPTWYLTELSAETENSEKETKH